MKFMIWQNHKALKVLYHQKRNFKNKAMSAPRSEKTKADADQTNNQLKDLNNAGYNRFRALKQGIVIVF